MFNTGNIQDKIEETASTYLKNQQYGYQPTTPFRPKQTRKEIGLFNSKRSTVERNTKNDIPKRKYSEISVSVFETEEVNAGDTNIYDDAFGTVTPKCAKLSKLDLEAPSNEPSNASRSRNLLLTIEDQALSVLSTPTIKRKKPSSLLNADTKKINPKNDKSINEDPFSLPTPTHSILKNTRHPSDNNEFSTEVGPLQRHRNLIPDSETDVLKAQIDENDREDCSPKLRSHHATSNFSQNRSRESTPGKSLRFNVPKRLPPTLVELDDGMKLGGIENYEPTTNGSPKSITASDSDNATLIPHENMFSPEVREEVVLDTLDYDSRQDENESELSLDKLENELDLEEEQKCPDYQGQKASDTLGNIQGNIETLVSSNTYNTLHNQTHKADEPKISHDEEISINNYNEEEESSNNVTKDEVFEDDIKNSNRTKSVTLADISVFQPDCGVADDEAPANDGIIDIAKESLSCFTDQADIDLTNENEINFEETKSTSNTEKLVNVSVYDTNEANEQDTLNNTLIRRIAHDIASSQAKDVDDSGAIEKLSQTLTVPEMSVYEPNSAQEDNNFDKTTIRKLAEEASSGSSEMSHIDKNDSLMEHKDEISNISIYESGKNDNKASNTTLIKELANSAHGADATKSPDKSQEGTDASQFSIDMSVYIDKDKEISPDPEVTLNFPTAVTPKEKETLANTAELSSNASDVSDSMKPPENSDFSTRDENVSVYDDIDETNPSANCISFIKALATEKVEHMKNKESTSGPNKTRSFDFSNPCEATPAAAAKQRHLSKSDKNQVMCSPVFRFSKPISSLDENETENTPMRSIEPCSDESFKNELSVKDINSDQHGNSIDQKDDVKQINNETEESNKCTSTSITDRQDMHQIESKNSPKDKSGSRFSFANPIDSLAIDITIKRPDVSSHLENRFNNEESATKLQFDFSAAESLVDCSKSSSIEIDTKEKEQETSLIFDQSNKRNIISDKDDNQKNCDDISIQDTVVEDSPDDNICLDNESGQPKTIGSNSKDSSEQSKQTGKIIF